MWWKDACFHSHNSLYHMYMRLWISNDSYYTYLSLLGPSSTVCNLFAPSTFRWQCFPCAIHMSNTLNFQLSRASSIEVIRSSLRPSSRFIFLQPSLNTCDWTRLCAALNWKACPVAWLTTPNFLGVLLLSNELQIDIYVPYDEYDEVLPIHVPNSINNCSAVLPRVS
jgi:hypothetical protein